MGVESVLLRATCGMTAGPAGTCTFLLDCPLVTVLEIFDARGSEGSIPIHFVAEVESPHYQSRYIRWRRPTALRFCHDCPQINPS